MASKPTIKEIEEYQAGLNGTSYYDKNGTASYDVISKPRHYMIFEPSDIQPNKGIEVRDVIEKLVEKMDGGGIGGLGYEPMVYADYVQLMQYLMRFMDKNGVEDLKKARWYLDKMIEAY